MAFAAFVIAGVLLLGVLPLKLAATWLGAERTGWIVCFFAGIVAGLTSSALNQRVPFGFVIACLISAVVYKLFLGTTYLRAVLIVLLQLVLLVVVAIVLFLVAPSLLGLVGIKSGPAQ